MSDPLSDADVRHVAALARLRLSDDEIRQCRSDLAAILAHADTLAELDLEGVEPMAHPLDLTNRLDDDTPTESMPLEQLLANAPAVEGSFLAVPKVLGDGGEA